MNNDFQEMPSIDKCYVKLSDLKLPIKRNPYDPNRDITGYIRYLKYNTNIADVRENVHAHWIHERLISTGGGSYPVVRCSACQWQYPMSETRFCPNCGAQMDERREE